MSLPLFRKELKSSLFLILIFVGAFTMYFSVIVTMYDPEMGGLLDQFADVLPGFMSAFGMMPAGGSLVDFLAAYLYGMLVPMLTMVFILLTANRLVAKMVDRGSVACLLAGPRPRVRIVLTQLFTLLFGILILIGYCVGFGVIISESMFKGDLDISAFVQLNLGALALELFIGGVAFFASCLFNDTKYSLALGAGIPVACSLIHMVANYGGDFANAKYATFFTLFSPSGMVAGTEEAFLGAAILGGGALLLYAGAVLLFCKRDIPV